MLSRSEAARRAMMVASIQGVERCEFVSQKSHLLKLACNSVDEVTKQFEGVGNRNKFSDS